MAARVIEKANEVYVNKSGPVIRRADVPLRLAGTHEFGNEGSVDSQILFACVSKDKAKVEQP
ncbi:hypothetical protein CsatB_000602 [Cannabis sativa]